jgi:hypothetical protein
MNKYEDNLTKYIKIKRYIDNLSECSKNILSEQLINNHTIAIVVLTIVNKLSIKNNKIQGYSLASGIYLLNAIINIYDIYEYHENKYDINDIHNLCMEITILFYNLIIENMKQLNHLSNDKLLKIYQSAIFYINKHLYKCIRIDKIKSTNHMKKHEIYNYNFEDTNLLKKYKKLHYIDKDTINKYINDKYGSIASIAIILGWIIGNGDDNKIQMMEQMGLLFGQLVKISNDFKNIERDIKYVSTISYNIVINLGIKESFRRYVESKTQFIELCMTCDIYTKVMSEIIVSFDNIINENLDKLKTIDLDTEFTSCTET